MIAAQNDSGTITSHERATTPLHEHLPVAIASLVDVVYHTSDDAGRQGSGLAELSGNSQNQIQVQTQNAPGTQGSPLEPVGTSKTRVCLGCEEWAESHKVTSFLLAFLLVAAILLSIIVPIMNSSNNVPVEAQESSAVQGSSSSVFELATISPCPAASTCEWTAIGPDLVGPSEGDFFGGILGLGKTPHGYRLSVSAPYYSDKAGYTAVYDIIEDGQLSSLEYKMLGREAIGRFFDTELIGTLSDDGDNLLLSSIHDSKEKWHVNVVAIQDDGSQPSLGGKLFGIDDRDEFGRAVINRDGSVLAVSDTLYNMDDDTNGQEISDAGIVTIYMVAENRWAPIQILTGKTQGEKFGKKMALSADGMTIAIGSSDYDNGGVNDEDYGVVRVYHYVSYSVWHLLCEIVGDMEEDKVGKEIKLSADGKTLAIAMDSAWIDENGKEGMGLVRVYYYIDEQSQWAPIGGDILSGTETHLDFGVQIDLTDDGRRMAIGQPRFSSDDLFEAGRVQVFDYIDDNWFQVGEDIVGERSCDVVGTGFDLSPDGSRLVVGFPNAEGMGDEGPECSKDGIGMPVVGFARLFELQMQ